MAKQGGEQPLFVHHAQRYETLRERRANRQSQRPPFIARRASSVTGILEHERLCMQHASSSVKQSAIEDARLEERHVDVRTDDRVLAILDHARKRRSGIGIAARVDIPNGSARLRPKSIIHTRTSTSEPSHRCRASASATTRPPSSTAENASVHAFVFKQGG